jgi:catechol 2,3-dioxygenase-like lactoylglutathione lyase family enzyme
MATTSTETDTPTVTISAYSHVNLQVTDFDRAMDFYCNTLGFEPIPRPDFGGFPGAWLQHGNAQIHLSVIEKMAERIGLPHLALMVPLDEFQNTCAALDARGVNWVAPPNSREDFGVTVWAAFIEDPDGNIIELTNAGPAY